MTGELDAELGPIAVDLIAEYGKAITLTRITAGVYDPATSKSTDTTADETINVLVEEYKGYDFANGLAIVGDKKLTVAAVGLTAPNLNDRVTIDSATFKILELQTIYSGELPALYVLKCRK